MEGTAPLRRWLGELAEPERGVVALQVVAAADNAEARAEERVRTHVCRLSVSYCASPSFHPFSTPLALPQGSLAEKAAAEEKKRALCSEEELTEKCRYKKDTAKTAKVFAQVEEQVSLPFNNAPPLKVVLVFE